MENRDTFDAALRAALSEIEQIGAAIAELEQRRETLRKFVGLGKDILGPRSSTPGLSLSAAEAPKPAPAPKRPASLAVARSAKASGRAADSPESAQDLTLARSKRRQFFKAVVEDAVAILERNGRPMAAAEILDEHPEGRNLTVRLLYKTLFKRIENHRTFAFRDGRFWIKDRDWP